jgi:predicted esterase
MDRPLSHIYFFFSSTLSKNTNTQSLAQQMPHLKFILPTAPTQPVTMNMGMPMPSWYDITGLDERSNENCKGIDVSRSRIAGILEAEHAATGLPYSRMMLAGFSQGGALALFTGMQLPQTLAGIVVMSGYMPAASQFQLTPGLENVPILHCHGTMDPMVKFDLAEKTKAKLVACGATNYEIKSFPIQHTVSPDELAQVSRFVQSVLPADDTCKIQLKDPSAMSVKELKAAIKKAGLGPKAVGFMEKSEFIRLLQDHRAGK